MNQAYNRVLVFAIAIALLAVLVPITALAAPDPDFNPPLEAGGVKIDDPSTGTFDALSPGVETKDPVPADFLITLTLRSTDDGQVLDFESNYPVVKVVIKGGTGDAQIYLYDPAVLTDEGLHCAVNPSGHYADVSHVIFYFETVTPTPTPTPEVTPTPTPEVTPTPTPSETPVETPELTPEPTPTITIPDETPPYGEPTTTPIDITETDPPEGPPTGQGTAALPIVIAVLMLAASAALVLFNHRKVRV